MAAKDTDTQMSEFPRVPLPDYRERPLDEMRARLADFHADVQRRRTVHDFSERPVPRDLIEGALAAAGTAPSGANHQRWHFAVVSGPETKRRIREAAEVEEPEFYEHRAPTEWLEALAPLGTDSNKPFLEKAPYLIAIFQQSHGLLSDGRKVKHYYPTESTGIAWGTTSPNPEDRSGTTLAPRARFEPSGLEEDQEESAAI